MDRNHRAHRSSGMAALGDFGFHPKALQFNDSHREQKSPYHSRHGGLRRLYELHVSNYILDQVRSCSAPWLKTRAAAGWWIAWAHGGGDQ
jgi:hypothetical protein